MGTNGRTSGELTEELMKANIAALGKACAASANEIMIELFDLAPPTVDRRTRLKVGDAIWMDKDSLILPACDRRFGCACGRIPVGKALARNGANLIASLDDTRGEFEFKVGPGLSLDDLPDYAPAPAKPYATVDDLPGDVVARAEKFTFSNLLAPMKPLTADSILEAMKTLDTIKARDAETKKRYDDMVMSGLKTHMDKPIMPDRYYWRLFLDAPASKPKLSEAEITRLQWADDDGGRHAPELFPVIREGAPRTQSQSIAAGLGVWGTRGDAKLSPEPKPYPYVSDEDLLPDA